MWERSKSLELTEHKQVDNSVFQRQWKSSKTPMTSKVRKLNLKSFWKAKMNPTVKILATNVQAPAASVSELTFSEAFSSLRCSHLCRRLSSSGASMWFPQVHHPSTDPCCWERTRCCHGSAVLMLLPLQSWTFITIANNFSISTCTYQSPLTGKTRGIILSAKAGLEKFSEK